MPCVNEWTNHVMYTILLVNTANIQMSLGMPTTLYRAKLHALLVTTTGGIQISRKYFNIPPCPRYPFLHSPLSLWLLLWLAKTIYLSFLRQWCCPLQIDKNQFPFLFLCLQKLPLPRRYIEHFQAPETYLWLATKGPRDWILPDLGIGYYSISRPHLHINSYQMCTLVFWEEIAWSIRTPRI